ncbi:DUF551 domain-containing protein [Bariatricus sp. SGI.161]|uniref:DUF551 domain-containing protein n=1 Tax=Bariatricus sp. SGI.161 TaxID=3420550 RepID=UPI003D007764
MIDEKKLIEEIEKIFETDEQNIDCTLSDFAYHVFDCIKAQPKVGEWIPCSERLPEKTGYYLVQLSRKLPNEDYADRVVVLYNGEDKEFMAYERLIIAWQPLPEPYKPGKEKRHTNADRIRAMSDEDLVEFMYSSDIPWCDDKICREGDNRCRECFKKWLQSEVEESDER